jgi:hypothetical protein
VVYFDKTYFVMTFSSKTWSNISLISILKILLWPDVNQFVKLTFDLDAVVLTIKSYFFYFKLSKWASIKSFWCQSRNLLSFIYVGLWALRTLYLKCVIVCLYTSLYNIVDYFHLETVVFAKCSNYFSFVKLY